MVWIGEKVSEVIKKMPSLEQAIIKTRDRPDIYSWGPFFLVDGKFVVHDLKYLDQENFHVAVTNETVSLGTRDDRECDSRLGVYLERKKDNKPFKLATPIIPYVRIGINGLAEYYTSPFRSSHCFVNDLGCNRIELGYCAEFGQVENQVYQDTGNGLQELLIGQQRRYTVDLNRLMKDLWKNINLSL